MREGLQRLLDGLRELPEGYFYELPMDTQKKLTAGWIALEEEVEERAAEILEDKGKP